jgi:hypothetical protein
MPNAMEVGNARFMYLRYLFHAHENLHKDLTLATQGNGKIEAKNLKSNRESDDFRPCRT